MERSDIINMLIEKYGYSSYLEIGYGGGYTFNKINATTKIGVDGGNGTPAGDTVVIRMRSEDYFNMLRTQGGSKFDIIFIDGSHLAEDVEKDLNSALDFLNEGGSIVMHDCSPPNKYCQERSQSPHCSGWTGDVWKAFVKFRATRSDLEMCVVDTDYGCGVVRRGQQKQLTINLAEDLTYDNLETNRELWLGLITPEEFTRRHR
jgi:hypothetical protein